MTVVTERYSTIQYRTVYSSKGKLLGVHVYYACSIQPVSHGTKTEVYGRSVKLLKLGLMLVAGIINI